MPRPTVSPIVAGPRIARDAPPRRSADADDHRRIIAVLRTQRRRLTQIVAAEASREMSADTIDNTVATKSIADRATRHVDETDGEAGRSQQIVLTKR